MKTDKLFAPRTAVPATSQASSARGPKEILVPIDFSEASIKALHHAAELALREHAHLTLLNIVEEPVPFRTLDQPALERRQQWEHEEQLQELARHELAPDVRAHLVVGEGLASEEITRIAARRHASLIVIGLHGAHGLSRWLHRHTANHVTRHAPCPVLVLGEDLPEPAPHKMAA